MPFYSSIYKVTYKLTPYRLAVYLQSGSFFQLVGMPILWIGMTWELVSNNVCKINELPYNKHSFQKESCWNRFRTQRQLRPCNNSGDCNSHSIQSIILGCTWWLYTDLLIKTTSLLRSINGSTNKLNILNVLIPWNILLEIYG